MQNLVIAYIQTKQFWQDKKANYSHFEKKLMTIDGAPDLVLLPEMFNTSFCMEPSLAEEVTGESISWMIKKAAEGNYLLGATLMIRDGLDVYNRFVIVNGSGIQASYNKMHLFSHAGEKEEFASGKQNQIFELKNWKILLKVCYDLRFPLDSRNNEKAPYDLAIYLANWPAKRSYAWRTLLQARAIENQAYVIGVNRIGIDGNEHAYDGSSGAFDPWGNKIHSSDNRDEIYMTTLRYSELEKIRESFNTLKDEIDDY